MSRTPTGGSSGLITWVLWHAGAFSVVLLVPTRYALGQPLWAVVGAEQIQAWIWSVAFLWLTLYLSRAMAGDRRGIARALVAAAMVWGCALILLVAQPTNPWSRLLALASMALGSGLALFPLLVRAYQGQAGALLIAVAAGFAFPVQNPGGGPVIRNTVLNRVSISLVENIADSTDGEGGGIERLGDGFLLVDAWSRFYRLEEDSTGSFRSTLLALPPPFDRAAYLRDRERDGGEPLRMSVTDILLDSVGGFVRVFLAHQTWHSEDRCFGLAVSVAPLAASAIENPWQTVFETKPCLSPIGEFDDSETGGRLAWLPDGSLLLSVGDHGFVGLGEGSSLAQDAEGSYGKIMRLDLNGGVEVYSMGHRNPQGLTVDGEGRVWSTEHGPEGGDEINVIEQGRNYGWPKATYGTQYGLNFWPLAPGSRDHGRFTEPAHAFVPSVAVSNLIQLRQSHFNGWKGDLLVGSLRLQSLYRVRTVGSRVMYVEPIAVGRRIRDLVESPDGRIILWTGQRDILVVTAGRESIGRRAYGSCSACHGVDLSGTDFGPSLRHVWDRPIATRQGFDFSPALRGLEGVWNDDRLDEFFRDPQAFAPGTSMAFPGLPDAATRRALIEFLRSNF